MTYNAATLQFVGYAEEIVLASSTTSSVDSEPPLQLPLGWAIGLDD